MTPAVPSGRSVTLRPPLSENVYISLDTTSVDSPTPRANNAVSSKIGSSTCPYPARRAAVVMASLTVTNPAEAGGT